LAIVTNVGAGCGGRGSVGRVVVFAGRALVRERTQRADDRRQCPAKPSGRSREAAYGKTVWSWRPWLASSWRRFAKPNRAKRAIYSSATEARRIRLRGARHKP